MAPEVAEQRREIVAQRLFRTLKELDAYAAANARVQKEWFWRELVPSLGL